MRIVKQEVGVSQVSKLNPTLQLIMVMLRTKYEVAAAYSRGEFCGKIFP